MGATKLLVPMLALTAFVAQAQVEPKQKCASSEETVVQIVRDYYDARVRRDAVVLERIMADDFTGIYSSNGHMAGKEQSIRNFTTPEGPKYDSIKVNDIKVRTYGAAAVVTCRVVEKGTYRGLDGKRHNISSEPGGQYLMRTTLVLIKQHELCQIVDVQATTSASLEDNPRLNGE